ncbi:T-cell receptor alpha chain V region HPB-MLT [Oryzias melastigma]|nr:T-cell receptor alpha chain V region HPB-MLT [Oryzias melastigma]
MEHWLWILLAALFFECRAQTDSVQQPGGDVTAAEGDSVTLGCHFNSSTPNYYLFWYKQEGNNRPMFILNILKTGTGTTAEEFKERFSSSLDSISRSVPLTIHNLHVSDSAVYYCALKPTVTGNNKTLYKNLQSRDKKTL